MDTIELENRLIKFGFTPAEAKVYLALLELGPSQAGRIRERAGVQNSVVHLTLERLRERGVVSFIIEKGIRVFQPSRPQNLIREIKERTKEMESLIPSLESMFTTAASYDARMYRGLSGLKNLYYDLIEDGKRKDPYCFFAFSPLHPDTYQAVFEFFNTYLEERLNRGFIIRGLANKGVPVASHLHPKMVRCVTFPLPQNMSIFRDKVAFIPWGEPQISFLLKSKVLADNFRDYFESVWKKAEIS